GEEKHMKQSLAKAAAFCFDCGMCFDEIPPSAPKEKSIPKGVLFPLIQRDSNLGVPEKSLAFWGEEKHMKRSLAKAAAFCFDCGMCFDEIPPSAPKKKALQTECFFL
ncbi:MAG: hypothetical protein J5964_00005, partial [Eubacterium sp.]|nr:hypothetical protein [Eubacterium sp.]